MNAADVLAEADISGDYDTDARMLAALLAHGEQGVAILPDGTLWALSGLAELGKHLHALPVSAEAGDTDG